MKKPSGYFFILACCQLLLFGQQAIAQHNSQLGAGNSYVNITKKSSGGFVQTGDTLEIRTNYFFGRNYNGNNIYSVRYYDSVPRQTQMCNSGLPDQLRLITNEGITVRSYTQNGNDDAATFTASPAPGQYQLRINIGSTPGAPDAAAPGNLSDATGSGNVVIGSYRPRLFGGTLITTAFRVLVTGSAGDTIVLAAAKLAYKKTAGGPDTVITLSPFKILISPAVAPTLCGNALGNNLSSEFGGTFDSGTLLNRNAAPTFLIPSYEYRNNVSPAVSVSDGSYSIVNNSSPLSSTSTNSRFQPFCSAAPAIPVTDSCRNRMHSGFWDIMGDHTGTNNAIGNAPVPAGSRGGYMLMVNADVVTSEAYRQSVTGLCPDTYYEFSAWVKNICRRCAIDSNSVNTYYPGVYPNLSFAIDGLDIYSTGELDTVGWLKKGFVFKTGPAQTSAIISIRNNASGGGGNDWVLDDLALGTCGPTMNMNYVPILLGCDYGTNVVMADTVKYSFNPNYSWYKWQRSTDGGITWGNPPVPTIGTATPVLTGGLYQYITNYPPFVATAADSGHRYRVIVANSLANLSNDDCLFTDGNYTELKLIDCGSILNQQNLAFTGRLLSNGHAQLHWMANSSRPFISIILERGNDGTSFGAITSFAPKDSEQMNGYAYIDPSQIEGDRYYRLKIIEQGGVFTYSKIIQLSQKDPFRLTAVVNPFKNKIEASVSIPGDGMVKMIVTDVLGKTMATTQYLVSKGFNRLQYNSAGQWTSGVYFMFLEWNGMRLQRKLTKVN